MKLDRCDYCLLVGRQKNLARVTFDEKNVRNYCPKCLEIVKKNVEDIPWIQKYGYKIEYPYK